MQGFHINARRSMAPKPIKLGILFIQGWDKVYRTKQISLKRNDA